MKRSDMLKVLKSETRGKIEDHELDHILAIVEESGMLPPDSTIRSYHVFDEEVHEIISEWEPEDE